MQNATISKDLNLHYCATIFTTLKRQCATRKNIRSLSKMEAKNAAKIGFVFRSQCIPQSVLRKRRSRSKGRGLGRPAK
ncbi:hypothetical protein ABTK20_21850, partial [Acinetobacter baumannii]